MTKAEYDREMAFADWYLKNGKSTPTFSDAIEWARKDVISKACDWLKRELQDLAMDEVKDNFLENDFKVILKSQVPDWLRDFRKAMEEQAMNWLRKLFKKKKTLRDKVVEMYGEEAGVYYDNLSQGIPIGGLLETAVFIDIVEEARRLLEAEKQLNN